MVSIKKVLNSDFPLVTTIWSRSVQATHQFLQPADYAYFLEKIPTEYLPQLDVYLLYDEGAAKGFCAVSGTFLEMLFVDADFIGKGYGKQLLDFARKQLGITHVDVNEQNTQACQFYMRHGFKVRGRSERDATGKPYPILHFALD